MRKLNTTSLNKIKQWEGLRLEAYQDQAGVWTIGYGHTGEDVYEGLTITKAKANKLLVSDLAWAIEAVESLVKVDLTDNQFGALVSFVFNVGTGAFRGSTLLRKLNSGDYDSVPKELARWNKITVGGKKVTNRGLVNRRAAEAGLWASGDFVASNTVEPEEEQPKPLLKKPEIQGPLVTSAALAGEQLTETGKQLSVIAEYSVYLQMIFVAIMIAGVGLTIYGFTKKREE